MLTLLFAALTGVAAGDPAAPVQAKDPPALAKEELFAKEGWYKEQKGEEKDFIGTLAVQKGGGAGIGRFNMYRLHATVYVEQQQRKVVDGKVEVVTVKVPRTEMREVYVGGKPGLLDRYVGKKVKLTGKAVSMEVVGRVHNEIWPARIEVLAEKGDTPPPQPGDVPPNIKIRPGVKILPVRPVAPAQPAQPAGKALKVIATAPWEFVTTDPDGDKKGQQIIIRSAKEFPNLYPWNKLDAPPQAVEKRAAAQVAKAFKVDSIDWDKQMIVVVTAGVKPTGGWKLDINAVEAGDKTVTVRYTLTPPQGAAGQAFTHPAVAALVERAEGEAKFVGGEVKKPKKIRPIKPIQIKQIQAKPIQIQPQPAPAQPAPAVQEKAGEDKGPKVIAQTPFRIGGRAGGHTVIRSAAELTKAVGGDEATVLARIAKQLKVEAIDWDKQMIVVVSGGTQRTGGYSVSVTGLEVKDKTLTVRWKLNTPKAGSPVTQAITYPAATVLVERFAGEVLFDPPAPKGGLKIDRADQ